jgi:hypothetical protein
MNGDCPERNVILRGPAGFDAQGFFVVSVPLAAIGNPAAVDVYAAVNNGTTPSRVTGDGDRAPDVGALDTRTGPVVVGRAALTSSRVFTDVTGDLSDARGLDLRAALFETVADQMVIALAFSRSFDPSSFLAGPRGASADGQLHGHHPAPVDRLAVAAAVPRDQRPPGRRRPRNTAPNTAVTATIQ